MVKVTFDLEVKKPINLRMLVPGAVFCENDAFMIHY
jgi:hypothetical protein